MAETFGQKQLERLSQSDRTVDGGYQPGIRMGSVVGPGKASTATATYWNIELLTHEFARTDINYGDRYATAAPVYVVLTNVAAGAGVSLLTASVVSVLLQDVVGNVGYLDATAGYYYVPGAKCVVLSAAGGGGCDVSTTLFGALLA